MAKSTIYHSFKRDLLGGRINLATDTIMAMLVTDGYVPDVRRHRRRSDVTHEARGPGYDAGGKELVGKTAHQEDSGEAVFDAADLVWPGATLTARGVVIYKSRGGAASADELCCYIPFDQGDVTGTNAPYEVLWDEAGIINLG